MGSSAAVRPRRAAGGMGTIPALRPSPAPPTKSEAHDASTPWASRSRPAANFNKRRGGPHQELVLRSYRSPRRTHNAISLFVATGPIAAERRSNQICRRSVPSLWRATAHASCVFCGGVRARVDRAFRYGFCGAVRTSGRSRSIRRDSLPGRGSRSSGLGRMEAQRSVTSPTRCVSTSQARSSMPRSMRRRGTPGRVRPAGRQHPIAGGVPSEDSSRSQPRWSGWRLRSRTKSAR